MIVRAFTIVGVMVFATSALAKGDVERGRDIAIECFACHGKDGNAPSPINPKIGGQHERYLVVAMKEYKSGKRAESLMRGAVLKMNDQEIEDVAAYYASQRAFTEAPPPRQGANAQARGPGGGGPGGPGGPGPGAFRMDKVERKATFVGLLASAEAAIKQAKPLGKDVCSFSSADAAKDSDSDGVMDAFDAAPANAAEFTRDSNGDGRFELCSIEQAQAIATFKDGALSAEKRMGRNYELARDLDAASIANWTPIGNCGPDDNCMMNRGKFGYMGVLDGRNFTIKNLTMSWPARGGVGLVGVLGELGMVVNLNLDNANIEGRSGTGAVVGANMGAVVNVHATAKIKAGLAVGGVVGGNSGIVADSSASGEVIAQQAAGGLVGDMTGGVIRSRASVKVSGDRALGGLVGLSTFGMVFDSVADGMVTGTSDLGGLVGMSTDGSINNSISRATVQGQTGNIGGVVGFNSLSLVRNAMAEGSVSGADAIGGLVGRNNGIVRRSFSAAAVKGESNTDPIVGLTVDGEVKSAFADLAKLTAEAPVWSPKVNTSHDLLDFYCDKNFSGAIEPAERVAANYVWQFPTAGGVPKLSCIP